MAAAFWGQYMSLGFLVPEVLRELRFWGQSSVCPWGAIGLGAVILSCCCLGVGFVCAALVFSAQCRRLVAYLARGVALSLSPGPVVGPDLQLQRRLSEYHRSS